MGASGAGNGHAAGWCSKSARNSSVKPLKEKLHYSWDLVKFLQTLVLVVDNVQRGDACLRPNVPECLFRQIGYLRFGFKRNFMDCGYQPRRRL